jgi:hypothetical protein
VSDNSVPRRIFGPKEEEIIGRWRKMHNYELNKFYSLPDIIRTIELRRMRFKRDVARMGEKRNVCMVLAGNQKEMDH